MSNFDIVIVALQGWDFDIGSNAKNIATEFSKKHRVLYVNPPLDLMSWLRGKSDDAKSKHLSAIKQKHNIIVKINDNLWNLYPDFMAVSINWIPNHFIFDSLNKRTNRQFASSISKALNELDFGSIVLFNDSLIFKGLYLKELLKPLKYVYYIRDFLIAQSYFKKHGIRLEPELIRKADVVVANSVYLTDYANEYNSNSIYVGQGCEIEMFDEDLIVEIPVDIQNLTHPLIGYVGFLTSMRLDIGLLIKIAESNLSWNIVLVGPEDEAFQKSRLHSFPNVFFLGKKNPKQLPAYIKAFDVCINPQVVNPMTIGNYPRKVDEYLAMGKPVVNTKTRAMEIFTEYCYLSNSDSDFINSITLALAEQDSTKKLMRKKFAKSHSWGNSVAEIYKAIYSN